MDGAVVVVEMVAVGMGSSCEVQQQQGAVVDAAVAA
jgi:hypothetical protein